MKADEYVVKYLETEKTDPVFATGNIAIGLALEIKEIAEKRGVKEGHGFISILNEINDKWYAIGKRLEKIKGEKILADDGFKRFLISRFPNLSIYWK